MFDYKLSEKDARTELRNLLDDSSLESDSEKLADVGLCYHILGDFDLAEEYYYKSYDLKPNVSAAINLSRYYIKTDKIEKLEKVCMRFAEDKIPMHPDSAIKAFAKHNRIETIKTLVLLGWRTCLPYFRVLYQLGEYDFIAQQIDKKYNFNKPLLSDGECEVLRIWLRCKAKLKQYEEINDVFLKVPIETKKRLAQEITQIGLEAEGTDVFMCILEDAYAELNYKDAEISKCLIQLYSDGGQKNEKSVITRKNIIGLTAVMDIDVSRIIKILNLAEATEYAEKIQTLYDEFRTQLRAIIDDSNV